MPGQEEWDAQCCVGMTQDRDLVLRGCVGKSRDQGRLGAAGLAGKEKWRRGGEEL